MFTHLRESAQGIFVKILLGLLVLSFGVWGIGDMFRQGGGSNSVATVGKNSVSMGEYQHALHNKQEELRQRLGKAYSPELAHKIGIESMVLQELVNNLIINTEATNLGIAVSDEDIARDIGKNPAFADKDGHFNKATFLAILKENGLNEARYVSDLRKDIAARLLVDTITSGIIVPNTLVEALYKSREEQRAADIIMIPASAIKQVPTPTDAELNTYYTAHSQSFLTPEYRAISYVELKASDIESKIEISEDEIKNAYEDRIQDFHKPEQRQVEQMLFEKEADAKKASDDLAHGKKFADIEKTAKIVNKGKTSLGLVTQQDVPAQAAAPVFALTEGSTTKPIQSDFGWHIFYVSKIVPEGNAPLSEVRTEITKELRAKKAQETTTRLANELEDELASGKSLDAAAEKIGQKVNKLAAINHEGKTVDGKKATIPAYDNFLTTAFSTNEKENSQALQAQDGSYFLIHVDNATPEHARPLAEVKDAIITALKKDKTEAILKKNAEDIAIEMRSGKKLSEALAKNNIASTNNYTIKLKRSGEITQGDKHQLPVKLISELFKVAPDETTHSYQTQSGDYVIATLKQITPAPATPDPKVLKAISDELSKTLANEAMDSYFYYLHGKYNVSVNESVMGATRDEEGGE